LLLVLLTLCLTCCNEEKASTTTAENVTVSTETRATCPLDPSLVEVLPYEEWLGLRDYVADTLRPIVRTDLEATECILIEVAKGNSHEELSRGLDRYIRQYCAMTDSAGHRLIYLNALCFSGEQPTKMFGGWQIIADGGDCYFQALFNLTTGTIVFFSVNGEA